MTFSNLSSVGEMPCIASAAARQLTVDMPDPDVRVVRADGVLNAGMPPALSSRRARAF